MLTESSGLQTGEGEMPEDCNIYITSNSKYKIFRNVLFGLCVASNGLSYIKTRNIFAIYCKTHIFLTLTVELKISHAKCPGVLPYGKQPIRANFQQSSFHSQKHAKQIGNIFAVSLITKNRKIACESSTAGSDR